MPKLNEKRYIPTSILQPIIKEAVDTREMGSVQQRVPENWNGQVARRGDMKKGQEWSAKIAVAQEIGLRQHVVYAIYNGTKPTNQKGNGLKFATVDRILTKLGLTHLWYEEPLSEYYNEYTW